MNALEDDDDFVNNSSVLLGASEVLLGYVLTYQCQ